MATVYLLDLTGYQAAPASTCGSSHEDATRDGYAPIDDSDHTLISAKTVSASPSVTSDAFVSSTSMSLAWLTAAELLRWPSWSLMEASWATTTRARELQARPSGPATAPSSYTLFTVPEPLQVTTKYYRASLRLVVGCAYGEESCPAHTHASATLHTLHEVMRLTAPPRTTDDAKERLAHPFGLVLVVRRSQDPSALPWHVLNGSRGGGCLCRAVLAFDDGWDDAHSTETNSDVRGETVLDDRWYDACVANGFEYIPHAAALLAGERAPSGQTPAVEHIEAGVEHAGLLGPTLRGSARLLQLLHSVLWPAHVRVPLAATPATDRCTEPTRPLNTLFVVATAAGQTALTSRLRCTEKGGGRDDESVARDGREQPKRRVLSRYHRRFFTDVLPACASRVQASDAITAADMSTTHALGLLLANRYQTSIVTMECLHPAFFEEPNSDVLRRLLEQRRGPSLVRECGRVGCEHGENDGGAEENCDDDDHLAIVVWPPDETAGEDAATRPAHTEQHVYSGTSLGYPSLSTILNTLLVSSGVPHVVVANISAAPLSTWDAHACAERGVECVELARPSSTDDADGPCGVDRLQEILHCARWLPVRTASQTPVMSSDTARKDAVANGIRVCVYGSGVGSDSTGCFATALREERWLRLLYETVLVPLSAATATETTSSDVSFVTACAPSLVLPSMTFHVANRYFRAPLSVEMEGGLAHMLRASRGVKARKTTSATLPHTSAVIILTEARVILRAATVGSSRGDSSNGKCEDDDDDETAAFHFATCIRALQRQLIQEEEARLEEWIDAPAQSERTAETETLALLCICDTAFDQEAAVDDVEAALCTILSGDVSSLPDNVGADQGVIRYPLFERVWAGTSPAITAAHIDANVTSDNDGGVVTDAGGCEGMSRVREALSQHVWPVRTALITSKAEAKEIATPPVSQDGIDLVTDGRGDPAPHSEATPSAGLAVADESNNADVVEAVVATIGCALPPNFLIDPVTMRSVHVHALDPMPTRPSCQSPTNEATAAAEVKEWVDKMRLHGGHLPASVRRHQAAVLALAMEAFL